MPGIVGVLRSDGEDISGPLATATGRLRHLESIRALWRLVPGGGLGQAWRDDTFEARDWWVDEAGGVAIAIAGHIFSDEGAPRRLRAADLAETYRAQGTLPAETYDGAFVIAVFDRPRGRLLVYNDRVGTQPVFYARTARVFCFAPEVKAVLAGAQMPPRLSAEGLTLFLTMGYCVGRRTLFEDVHALEPGSCITVDMDSLALDVRRYWNLEFRPARELKKRRAAEDAYYDTLLRSHRLVLCDDPHSHEVLLTGGLDSRGAIAFFDAVGRPPSAAFTWGLRDDIPESDACVARAIAELYGVPFRFLRYDTDAFLANAREWAYTSELANDNIGWYAEGQPILASAYRSGAAFTVAGDVVWDGGGFAFNDYEVRVNSVPPFLAPELIACLRPEKREFGVATYDAALDGVLATCDSDDLTDRKDYLYYYARMARFILSLGYYRELAVEVRRPFLSRAAIALFQALPQSHRVEKSGYVSMMQRRFPRLMRIEEQTVLSLPDWEHDLRAKPDLRAFFLEYLDGERIAGGALGGLMDPAALGALRDAYFNATPTPVSRAGLSRARRLRRRLVPFVQRHRTIDHVSRILRGGARIPARSTFDVLRSVALVTLLEEQLARFAPEVTST